MWPRAVRSPSAHLEEDPKGPAISREAHAIVVDDLGRLSRTRTQGGVGRDPCRTERVERRARARDGAPVVETLPRTMYSGVPQSVKVLPPAGTFLASAKSHSLG